MVSITVKNIPADVYESLKQSAEVSTGSAYDCEFVALARDLKASLITVDRQLLADFPDTAISLEAFVGVT